MAPSSTRSLRSHEYRRDSTHEPSRPSRRRHLPRARPLNLADKLDGPGAAMVISAGIGLFVLGFFTILSEASTGAKAWLQTFPLSVAVAPHMLATPGAPDPQSGV